MRRWHKCVWISQRPCKRYVHLLRFWHADITHIKDYHLKKQRQFLMTGNQATTAVLDGWQQKYFTNILEMLPLHIFQKNMSSSRLSLSSMDTTQIHHITGELCYEIGTNLISLHPHTVRLFHPLNVATFKPLQMGWKTAVLDWHKHNPNKMFKKELFTPVLHVALKK